jgi:hypothetical protein
MKIKFLFVFLLAFLTKREFAMSQDEINKIVKNYEKTNVSCVGIKQDEMLTKINQLNKNGLFVLESVGKSFEGRDIYLVKLGTGTKKIMLWSQMHGDEPTATLAILDILNYFNKNKDDKKTKKILSNVQIMFLPMLNPDGAEHFKRRNAQDIDINRDASRLQTPEGQILKALIDKHKPDFGFNLHDQDPCFAVGSSDSLVTIALLAPAIDEKNTTDKVRKRAKQIVVYINEVLNKFIPGHISKYDDEYEKRAFGDNIQSWGTSTILIESGGWSSDPGKENIRKLNFIAIIASISSISDGSYSTKDVGKYDQILDNKRNFYDLIFRGCSISSNGHKWISDIAINFVKDVHYSPVRERMGKIVDMGDLSTMNGINEIDASTYQTKPGAYVLIENNELKKIVQSKDSIIEYLKKGITTIISERDANLVGLNQSSLNLIFLANERYSKLRMMLNREKPVIDNPDFLTRMQDICFTNPFTMRGTIKLNRYADLVFTNNGDTKLVFVNGVLIFKDGALFDERPGMIHIDK